MGFGQQFVLMQRIKEISVKGTSKISAPKAEGKPAEEKELQTVVPLIEEAILEKQVELRGLAVHISHTSRLAERLFQKGDTTMTVATMRKVKSIQEEFIHGLRVIAALNEYLSYIQTGHLGTKNVSKDLAAILSGNKPSGSKQFNDLEIMGMVAAKQFFPVMDSSTGMISFQEHSPISEESSERKANKVVTSAA